MIDIDSIRKRDIQNAARQTRDAVGNFGGIHFDRDVHRKKGDGEFLGRRCWRILL
jgi:hypothetical protein